MWKALCYSIASASLAGLLAGGVMKLGPHALADRPIGPQILVFGADARVIDPHGWYAEADLVAYNGQLPEHVLGTDWAQPTVDEAPAESYDDASEAYAEVEDTVFAAPVKISSPPPIPVSYPSIDGDILSGLHEAEVVEAQEETGALPS